MMEMKMIVGRREVICQPLPTTAHLAPLNELIIGIFQNAKCPSRRQANMGRFLTIRLENERELSKWDPRWTRR